MNYKWKMQTFMRWKNLYFLGNFVKYSTLDIWQTLHCLNFWCNISISHFSQTVNSGFMLKLNITVTPQSGGWPMLYTADLIYCHFVKTKFQHHHQLGNTCHYCEFWTANWGVLIQHSGKLFTLHSWQVYFCFFSTKKLLTMPALSSCSIHTGRFTHGYCFY